MEPVTPKKGRPRKFNARIGRLICTEIASGKSLRKTCAKDGMPHLATVMRWLYWEEPDEAMKEFREQYARARESLLEHWAEECIEISDDGANDTYEVEVLPGVKVTKVDFDRIQRSKLRVDTRRWLLSKLAPKRYGDKLELSGPGPKGEHSMISSVEYHVINHTPPPDPPARKQAQEKDDNDGK